MATKIVGSLDFDATLLSISNAAVDVLNANMVGIMSADDDRLKMITCAGNRNIAAARFEAGRGEGVAGIVFETGSSFRLDDFRSARSISPHIRDIAEKEGIRAALGAPMLANGQVIGAVLAWSSHPAAFDEEDEEVLAGMANLAAIAIQNARLYESAREAADRLELANRALRPAVRRARSGRPLCRRSSPSWFWTAAGCQRLSTWSPAYGLVMSPCFTPNWSRWR